MRRFLVALVLLLSSTAVAQAAPHWEADLVAVQAPPVSQTSVKIMRKLGVTGTYTLLATLTAAPWGTFTDVGPYTDGQVVCWRFDAVNATGTVPGTEGCSGAPVQLPGTFGIPTINWRFVPGP